MSEKRPTGSSADQPRVKRSRFEPVGSQQNGGSSPTKEAAKQAAPNGLTALQKLQKAKELLAKKDVLKAQLQALKDRKASAANAQNATQASVGLVGRKFGDAAPRPAPLRLDEHGREVGAASRTSQQQRAASEVKGPRPEEFIDPNVNDNSFRRLQRRPRAGFDFIKAGTFQKEAEQRRLKAAFGDNAMQQKGRHDAGRKQPMPDQGDANLVPLGERAVAVKERAVLDPIPDAEWWDAALLLDAQAAGEAEDPAVNEKKITIYVEHPVPLDPPAEEAPPPPMPLPLTQKERKKLRTQRRTEKEKEKQELIRQGLLEPPKPKLKLSTFYRSLGSEAAADPTAIEQQVRADQEARVQAHEDRNLANKLTPAEKREKKIRKLTGAAKEGEAVHVALYRINDLSLAQHRFKVKANAEELHMTGCVVITDSAAVVMVEGGPKAQKYYSRLLLHRIDWNPEDESGAPRRANGCSAVWTGTVKSPAFTKMEVEVCRTEAAARKFLGDRGLQHYWDQAMADAKAG